MMKMLPRILTKAQKSHRYVRKDCGKCTRIIKNSKGHYCTALERYVDNYEVIGEYKTKPNSNVIINGPEKDQYDPKCDFNPSADYNPYDYVEPMDRVPEFRRDNY